MAELLLEGSVFFPMLSATGPRLAAYNGHEVKPDFVRDMPNVQFLGHVGPVSLVGIEEHALQARDRAIE